MEALDGVNDFLLCLFIPRTLILLRVHAVGEVERRTDIEHVKQRKVTTDGNHVLHTVAPVLCQAGVHQFVFLSMYLVLELTSIAHTNLLVPTLLTHHVLSAEGIELRHVDVQIRHRQVYN